jgi:hypothetical protein
MFIATGLAVASALAAAALIEGKGQFEKPEELAEPGEDRSASATT